MPDQERDPAPPPSIPDYEIQPGDGVRIRDSVMASRHPRMTPKDLCRIGWPNFFFVKSVFVKRGKVCLELGPCCGGWMRHCATREKLCDGHPAEHFERTEEVPPHAEDRLLDVRTPFGPILEFAYHCHDRNPDLFVKLFGRWKFSLLGELSRIVAKPLKDAGFL